MGYGMTVYCRKCGEEQQFLLGIGMMDCGFENFLARHFSEKKRSKILSLVDNCTPEELHYGARLYCCPKCEVLHERCCVGLEKDGAMVFETQFRCGRCHSTLVPTELDAREFRCWYCGEKALEERGGIHWD